MRALAIALAAVAACSSVELDKATTRYATGPAATRAIRKVVAVRASCGSLSGFSRTGLDARRNMSDAEKQSRSVNTSVAVSCTDKQLDAVDQLVRSALEFRGYAVVDSERVNAVTAERTEVVVREQTRRSRGRLTAIDKKESVVTGSLFADAPPTLQDRILAELGAEGMLNARIFIGSGIARSPRRDVLVQVRLIDVTTGELAWASRCRVNAGWDLDEVAVMKAARCAVDKIEVNPR